MYSVNIHFGSCRLISYLKVGMAFPHIWGFTEKKFHHNFFSRYKKQIKLEEIQLGQFNFLLACEKNAVLLVFIFLFCFVVVLF